MNHIRKTSEVAGAEATIGMVKINISSKVH